MCNCCVLYFLRPFQRTQRRRDDADDAVKENVYCFVTNNNIYVYIHIKNTITKKCVHKKMETKK